MGLPIPFAVPSGRSGNYKVLAYAAPKRVFVDGAAQDNALAEIPAALASLYGAISVVAGARNHRNRLASPSRRT